MKQAKCRMAYGALILGCAMLSLGGGSSMTEGTGVSGGAGDSGGGGIRVPAELLAQHTAKALNLSDCQIINLSLPQTVKQALTEYTELPPFTISLPIRGQQCTLELWPHSVRSPEYFEVKAQQEDGSWITHNPGPVRTVRGIVVDAEGIPLPGNPKVAGSVGTDGNRGFRGMILMPDQSEVWIEPLADRVPGAKTSDYVVYESTAMFDRGFDCGVEERHKGTKAQRHQTTSPLTGPVDDTLYCAEIAFDVDFGTFSLYGDVGIVQQRIEAMLNLINLQYEPQVHITHLATAVIIRTSEPDPYDNPVNMTELMSQFIAEWRNNQSHIPRDVVMLLAEQNLDVLGSAMLWSVCDPNRAYFNVQGIGIPLTAGAMWIPKHELGHNWGALHCACPGNTMNSVSGGHLSGFSQVNIDRIIAFRDSVGCLDICGVVEVGSTSIPFLDDFEGPSIDPTLWIGVDGMATTSNLGGNEPSGSQSLRISGNSEIRSAFMDTSDPWGIELRFWWQPGGLGTPPGPNDQLIVDYFLRNFEWFPIAQFTGDGSSGSSYELFSWSFPGIGHDHSRIRIRSTTSGKNGSDWFVDDVQLIPIQFNPCPEDCQFVSDGVVDIHDLVSVLSAFGDTGPGNRCDVTPQFPDGSFGNGVINIDDIVAILNNWGPCE